MAHILKELDGDKLMVHEGIVYRMEWRDTDGCVGCPFCGYRECTLHTTCECRPDRRPKNAAFVMWHKKELTTYTYYLKGRIIVIKSEDSHINPGGIRVFYRGIGCRIYTELKEEKK